MTNFSFDNASNSINSSQFYSSMQQSEITIRKARVGDLEEILELVRELAVYEKEGDEVTADLRTYEHNFADGTFDALVALYRGQIAGVTIYYTTFSTWKGKMIYLEDFVVREQLRGKGIGKLLFDRFITESRKTGAVLCKWQVLDWNQPAINFYKKEPTVFEDEWINVKYFL